MLAGAAMIFFAYLGFDAVSTNAEEAKNPKRDLPIGIIGSLLVCTVLYIAVAGVLTGMVPYDQIDKDAPIADAFARLDLPWFTALIIVGAVTGITSVLLVMMLGQARIFLAMARDGLMPKALTHVHPTFKTPIWATLLTGLLVSLGGSLLPLDILADLTSIGTLFAFVVVCAAVLVLRITQPDAPRAFKAPLGMVTPILGILLCLGAAASYGLGSLWAKMKLRNTPPLSMATGQLLCSSLIMTVLAFSFDNPSQIIDASQESWIALLALALLSTSFAYILFFRVVAQSGPANVLLVTMLIPVSAIAMGITVLGETLDLLEIIGTAVIIFALVIIDGRALKWLRPGDNPA